MRGFERRKMTVLGLTFFLIPYPVHAGMESRAKPEKDAPHSLDLRTMDLGSPSQTDVLSESNELPSIAANGLTVFGQTEMRTDSIDLSFTANPGQGERTRANNPIPLYNLNRRSNKSASMSKILGKRDTDIPTLAVSIQEGLGWLKSRAHELLEPQALASAVFLQPRYAMAPAIHASMAADNSAATSSESTRIPSPVNQPAVRRTSTSTARPSWTMPARISIGFLSLLFIHTPFWLIGAVGLWTAVFTIPEISRVHRELGKRGKEGWALNLPLTIFQLALYLMAFAYYLHGPLHGFASPLTEIFAALVLGSLWMGAQGMLSSDRRLLESLQREGTRRALYPGHSISFSIMATIGAAIVGFSGIELLSTAFWPMGILAFASAALIVEGYLTYEDLDHRAHPESNEKAGTLENLFRFVTLGFPTFLLTVQGTSAWLGFHAPMQLMVLFFMLSIAGAVLWGFVELRIAKKTLKKKSYLF